MPKTSPSLFDLSILIPARNEQFLKHTVEDILRHKRGNTEIIVGLDGQWPNPPLESHPDVTVFYEPTSIGQRAMANQLCRLSKAKYVCKLDAHVSIDKGWDVKMVQAFKDVGDDVVMTSTMRNLHAFDWVCQCGHRSYQDKGSTCPQCGSEMSKDICWRAKRAPNSTSFCFDPTPHFQYFNDYKKHQVGDYVESMSLQGSCFMLTRDNWWRLNICDEAYGSWGSQGIEVACKFWLSGGRVIVNRTSWYAHMFRTKQATGFGFPYPMSGTQQKAAQDYARDQFFNQQWPMQKKPVSWLVGKFNPPHWSSEDIERLKNHEQAAKVL